MKTQEVTYLLETSLKTKAAIVAINAITGLIQQKHQGLG
jgi:hypothetical protein